MSFRAWLHVLLCLGPKPAPDRRRARYIRKRKYKRAQELGISRPCPSVQVSESVQRRPETSESRFMGHEACTPPSGMQSQQPLAYIGSPTPVYHGAGRASRLPPSPPRKPVEFAPSRSSIEAHIVKEMITIIGRAFPHIPYAVNGLTAMIHHGYTKRLPSQVTMLCPSTSREVIRCWAISQGMLRVQGDSDAFGVITSDHKIRAIKITFQDTDFEDLEIVRGGEAQTRVMGLPAIADQIAQGYVDNLATAPTSRQFVYAEDMCWVLRKMVCRGEHLTHRTASSNILHRGFWLPFTLSFPDTVPLFESLGLAAPVDDLDEVHEIYYLDSVGGLVNLSSGSKQSTTTPRGSFSSADLTTGTPATPESFQLPCSTFTTARNPLPSAGEAKV